MNIDFNIDQIPSYIDLPFTEVKLNESGKPKGKQTRFRDGYTKNVFTKSIELLSKTLNFKDLRIQMQYTDFVVLRDSDVERYKGIIDEYNINVILESELETKYREIRKYFNRRVDDHIHLGTVIKSYRNSQSKELITTVEEVANYINSNNFTDVIVLYRDYNLLRDLKSAVDADIKGLYFVESLEDDISKEFNNELFSGLKLHNIRTKDGYLYSDERLFDMLNQLDSNMMVLNHCQQNNGTYYTAVKYDSVYPMFEYARSFPDLKFILGHAGAYGRFVESMDVNEEPRDPKAFEGLLLFSNFTVVEYMKACSVNNVQKNILLDNTCSLGMKAQVINRFCRSVTMGSDFQAMPDRGFYTYKNLLQRSLGDLSCSKREFDLVKAFIDFKELDLSSKRSERNRKCFDYLNIRRLVESKIPYSRK